MEELYSRSFAMADGKNKKFQFLRNCSLGPLRWQWQEQEVSILVLGDIINMKLWDIVHADACLLEGDPLKID